MMQKVINYIAGGVFLVAGLFFMGLPESSAQYSHQGTQGTIYAVKGGLTMGNQRWSQVNRRPLMKYHIAGMIESWNDENSNAVFAQLGYHLKGSAIRFNRRISQTTGQELPGRTDEFRFHNISLVLGAKQKFEMFTDSRLYYLVGVRADYNLKADFDRSTFENVKEGVNRITAGVTVGGGLEVPFSRRAAGFVELTVSPDFTNQIFIPPHRNWRDPNRMNPEQKVINVSIELSFGLRFMREVIYY